MVVLMKKKEENMCELVRSWLVLEVIKRSCINRVGIFRYKCWYQNFECIENICNFINRNKNVMKRNKWLEYISVLFNLYLLFDKICQFLMYRVLFVKRLRLCNRSGVQEYSVYNNNSFDIYIDCVFS